jgi:hypothetical protein
MLPPWAHRLGGLASAVATGKLGNSAWGRSMAAGRGGKAMRIHAPLQLIKLAAMGRAAQAAKRAQVPPKAAKPKGGKPRPRGPRAA